MVKIRLSRFGRKDLPFYRIVITNAREKRESNFIEFVGTYSPMDKKVTFNEERTKYWVSVGAQPTDTVRRLLVKQGILNKTEEKKTYTKKPGRKATERAKKAE